MWHTFYSIANFRFPYHICLIQRFLLVELLGNKQFKGMTFKHVITGRDKTLIHISLTDTIDWSLPWQWQRCVECIAMATWGHTFIALLAHITVFFPVIGRLFRFLQVLLTLSSKVENFINSSKKKKKATNIKKTGGMATSSENWKFSLLLCPDRCISLFSSPFLPEATSDQYLENPFEVSKFKCMTSKRN